MPAARHMFQIYIRASQEQVWQAITDPEFTRRYFHGTALDAELEPGSGFRYLYPDGREAVEGTIEAVDPPHRLVMTWRALYDTALAAEPPSRVEWQLAPGGDGVTRVTAIHADLGRSPLTSASVADGWVWILDSMKSLLETGAALPPAVAPDGAAVEDADGEAHRAQAIDANNSIWELLGRDDRSAEDDEDLVRRAYAAAYHWARAVRRGPENEARAEYMIAKVHWTLGRADPALHHARRCWAATTAAGLKDFDLAYAHEAMARALVLTGDDAAADEQWAAARAVPIEDDEDRRVLESDLATPLR